MYKALVVRVVDGDTIDVILDLGFNMSCKQRLRMLGYDAPETYRPKTLLERVRGEKATSYLNELIGDKEVIVETSKSGKYGRYLANVYLPNDMEESVNDKMVAEGHVK